jgi:hypothetical protein
MEVPLTRGYVALIDDEDADEVSAYSWFAQISSSGVVYAKHKSRTLGVIYMHRLILPGFERIDHRNGDGRDNRRLNLRSSTQSQNIANARKRRQPGITSQFKGVRRVKPGTWEAHCVRDRLGVFATEEAAARAYDTAASSLWGEFARLNFPEESCR